MKFEWRKMKFSDIVEFNPKESLPKGTVSKKIGMDKLQPFCRDITEYEITEYTGGCKFRNGDTIMARITPCLENGKTSKVNILNDDEIGFGSTEYIVFRAKSGITDPDYIYYLVCSPSVREPAIKSMVGSSGRQRVQTDVIQKLEFAVPSFEEQVKIGSVLKALDDKIALNTAINDNLEQQAIEIYNILANSTNKKVPLSNFIAIKHGYAFKGDFISTEDNGVVLVTPGNFCIGGGFKESKCKYFISDYSIDYVLQPGDIIVTMTDLSKDADTLGYSALVPDISGRKYLHNQRIGLVQKISNELPLAYIYWYMRSFVYHLKIVGSASGSTVKHTSPGRILEQLISVPESTILSTMLPLLENINQEVSANNKENQKLIEIRDALLPKLMSGELDISNIEF